MLLKSVSVRSRYSPVFLVLRARTDVIFSVFGFSKLVNKELNTIGRRSYKA